MKKIPLLIILICCAALIACSNQDSEAEAFIGEFNSMTNEMVKKINENPSSAGIDEAQEIFDNQKSPLKEKFDSYKDTQKIQISETMQKKLINCAEKNSRSLSSTVLYNKAKFVGDKDAMKKFQNLVKDYDAAFDVKDYAVNLKMDKTR